MNCLSPVTIYFELALFHFSPDGGISIHWLTDFPGNSTIMVFTSSASDGTYAFLTDNQEVGCVRIERFSFECRKVMGFAFTTLRDWFKKLAPLFHPIRSKTKTNQDSLVRVFPRFASAACNYFVF